MPIGATAGLAGIQFGSDLATNLINRAFAKKDLARQMGYEKHMADYQFSKNVDMWNMMNQYNLPSEQMQRLKDAGLNPALMYKTAPQNVATQLPRHQVVRAPVRLGPAASELNVLGAYNDIRMKNAQIDLLNEQRRVQEAQADYYHSIAVPRSKGFFARTLGEQIQAASLRSRYGLRDPDGVYWADPHIPKDKKFHESIGYQSDLLRIKQQAQTLSKTQNEVSNLALNAMIKAHEYHLFKKYGIKQVPYHAISNIFRFGVGLIPGVGKIGKASKIARPLLKGKKVTRFGNTTKYDFLWK